MLRGAQESKYWLVEEDKNRVFWRDIEEGGWELQGFSGEDFLAERRGKLWREKKTAGRGWELQRYFEGRSVLQVGVETWLETRRNTLGKHLERKILGYYFYRLILPCSCHLIVFSGHLEILFWCSNVFVWDPHLFLWSFELACICLMLDP